MSVVPGPQDSINRSVYARPETMRSYERVQALQPAEVRLLVDFRDDFDGRRVLDLGCGAGRTTAYLRLLTDALTGADYSPVMIEACRTRFPEIRLAVADARDLAAFRDGEFETVLFSYNGLDSMSHADRLRALGAIRRVLAPGGLFAFSSHNRGYGSLVREPRMARARHPRRLWQAWRVHRRRLANRRRNHCHEQETPEYAIWNDAAQDYALLNYYIALESQKQQLTRARFRFERAYGMDGRTCEPGDQAASCWITYAARRGEA